MAISSQTVTILLSKQRQIGKSAVCMINLNEGDAFVHFVEECEEWQCACNLK